MTQDNTELKSRSKTHASWQVEPVVVTVSAVSALTLFGDSLLYSVLPLYAESLGIPLVFVGVLLSANRWVRLVTNPLAARLYQRFGLYRPLITATCVTVLSTLIYAYPQGLVLFIAARMLWGFCWSLLRLGSYLVILGTSRHALGLAMGTMHAVTRLGSAFTVLVGGWLIDALGYQSGMTIMASLSVLAIGMVMWLNKQLGNDRIGMDVETPKRERQGLGSSNTAALSPLFCNLATFVSTFVGSGLVVSSLSLILQQRIGSTTTLFGVSVGIATISGLLFAVRWTSNLLLSPIVGYLSDRWGRRMLFIYLLSANALFLTSLALIPAPLTTIMIACLLFLVGNSLEVVLDAAIGDTTSEQDGAKQMSVYAGFHDFGAASGPLLGYIIGVNFGFSMAYLVGTALMVVLIVLYFFQNRPPCRQTTLGNTIE